MPLSTDASSHTIQPRTGGREGVVLRAEMHRERQGLSAKVTKDGAQRVWTLVSFFKNKAYIDDYPIFSRLKIRRINMPLIWNLNFILYFSMSQYV